MILAKPATDDEASNKQLKTLQDLGDPRIWVIGTEDSASEWKAHYFRDFVEDIMPTGEPDPAEDAISKILELIGEGQKEKKENEDGGQ